MLGNNYFQILESEQRYDIEQKLLQDKYLAKQMEHHPDLVVEGASKIRNIETSMLLNEAYKVLSDDYKRAEYLLKLNGFEFSNQQLNSQLSIAELEGILEEYEEIEAMHDPADLEAKEQQKLAMKAELIREITDLFNKNNFTKALDISVRLKYLTNLVGNIKLKIKHANNRD